MSNKTRRFLALILIISVILFLSIYPDAEFWKQFWPDFISNLIVGILLTYVIAQIVESGKKRDALFILNVDAITNENLFTLRFQLKNSGDLNYQKDDINWSVYIHEHIVLDDTSLPKDVQKLPVKQIIEGNIYWQYIGFNQVNIFPGRTVDVFATEVSVIRSNVQLADETRSVAARFVDLLKISYFRLSTAYGMIPDDQNIQQLDPEVLPIEYVNPVELTRMW